MWLLFAILGYFCYAVVFILDKHILTHTVSRPVVYTFYSTVISLVSAIFLPFVDRPMGVHWFFVVIGAISFFSGLWMFFIAVEKSELSHVGPFNGAVLTVSVYILSSIFLDERFTSLQSLGIFLLVAASFLLSMERSRTHSGFHSGFVWAFFSACLFALSQVVYKYLYLSYSFFTVLVWVSLFIGVLGLALLSSAHVRALWKKKRGRRKKEQHPFVIVLDKVLAFAAVLLVQYAVASGSVVVVNALTGLQFIFMFSLILLVSHIAPRIFREYITRRELVTQAFAIVLVCIGLALVVV